MRCGRRAGGEDGGALVGSEASGLAAAARYVGSVRSPKPCERVPGERPDWRGRAGITGGALYGGHHHRSGRGRAAGLAFDAAGGEPLGNGEGIEHRRQPTTGAGGGIRLYTNRAGPLGPAWPDSGGYWR